MTSHFKLFAFAIKMHLIKTLWITKPSFNLDVDHLISLVIQAESQFQSSNVGGK